MSKKSEPFAFQIYCTTHDTYVDLVWEIQPFSVLRVHSPSSCLEGECRDSWVLQDVKTIEFLT